MTGATRLARAVALAAGLFYTVFGAWALIAPQSFYGNIALFSPYNRHLIHDVGAFQLGIGAVLFAALIWRDALVAALSGAAAGSVAHVVAHVLDSSLGGRSTDVLLLSVLAVSIGAAAIARGEALRRQQSAATPP